MKKFKLPQDFIIELRLGSGVGEVVLGPYVLTAHLKYLELCHSGTTLLTAARGADVQIIKTSGQLHIKTSELVLQSEGFPYDSTYWPTGVTDNSLSTFDIIGELEVTSVEISDIGGLRYAESLSVPAAAGSKVLTPVSSFDFYQDFYGEFGVSSNVTPGSEFLMKEGSYCKVLPADLSGDFFLMFDFVPETSGSFVLMSQEGLSITVEETSVTMEIGSEVHTVTYVSKTDGSADRIVFDRQGRGLTVQCNGSVGEFISTFKCAKSIEADIFVGFKGKVSAVAFLGYSYLRGETLDLDREAVNVISCKETIPEGEDSPFSMREDGDWSLAVDDGDCFNFGFFSDVDTDVTSNISVVDGKLIIGGVTFSDSGVWNYISLHRKGEHLDVYVDKVFSGTVPYTGDITGAEGIYQIFCCNVQEGLNLTSAPLEVRVEPYMQYRMEDNSPFCEVSGHAMKITGSSKIVDGKFYSSQTRTLELPSFLVEENEDFTIELKFNAASLSSNFALLTQWNTGSSNNSWILGGSAYSFYLAVADSSGLSVGEGPSMPRAELKLNTDHHVAVTRENGTMRIFLDGKLKSTVYLPAAFYKSTLPVRNGWADSAGVFGGYLWDIRMVKGKSLYSEDFTPYVLPAYKAPRQLQESNICQQVSLRKHNTLTDLGDVIELIGGAPQSHQISYGRLRALSARMDAQTFKIPCRYFGAGDFTIETNFRINYLPASPNGYAAVIARHNRLELNTQENRWLITAATPDYPHIAFTAYTDTPAKEGDVVGKYGFSYTLRSNGAAQVGVDYHIAIVRKSGKVYMFLDGVQQDMVLDFDLPLRGQGDTPEENYFTGTYGDLTGTTELYSAKEVWNIRISDKAQYEIGKNFKPLNRLPTVFPSLDGVTDLDAAFAIDGTSIKGDLIEYVSTIGGEKFLKKVPKGNVVTHEEGSPLSGTFLGTVGYMPTFEVPLMMHGDAKWTLDSWSNMKGTENEVFFSSHNSDLDRLFLGSWINVLGVWNNAAPPRLQTPDAPSARGRFRHVAYTYDNGVIRIYLNGVLRTSGNWKILPWTRETFTFGSHTNTEAFLFDGYRIREGIHFTDNFNIHTIYPEGRRSVTHDGFEMDLLGHDTKVTERGIEIYNGAVEIKDVPYFGAEDFHISVDFTSLEDSASVANYVFGQYFNGTLVDERNSWNLLVRTDSNRVLQWVERRGNSTTTTSATLSTERFSLQNNVKYKIEVIKTSGVVSLYVDGTFYSSVVSHLPLVEVGLPIYTEQYEDATRYGSCSKILNNLTVTVSESVKTRLRILGSQQEDGVHTVQSITPEGEVVSTFQAYCDVTTPRGPFVLTLDWKNVTESILAKEVMDLEFNAVTVTDDPVLFPVVPSGTLINTSSILFKSEHPSWVSTQGPWTIVDCGLINGSIPSSGQRAWNELKGEHLLFGRDAGWRNNIANAEFGFMTVWGNQGICGGADRVGIPACPLALPNPSNLHFDRVYRKQVYVKAEF